VGAPLQTPRKSGQPSPLRGVESAAHGFTDGSWCVAEPVTAACPRRTHLTPLHRIRRTRPVRWSSPGSRVRVVRVCCACSSVASTERRGRAARQPLCPLHRVSTSRRSGASHSSGCNPVPATRIGSDLRSWALLQRGARTPPMSQRSTPRAFRSGLGTDLARFPKRASTGPRMQALGAAPCLPARPSVQELASAQLAAHFEPGDDPAKGTRRPRSRD
jgi:hypothetical protein